MASDRGFSIDPPTPQAREVGIKQVRRPAAAQPTWPNGESARPAPKPPSLRQMIRHIGYWIMGIINVIVATAMIFAAYSERIPPSEWGPAVVVAMSFPAWLLAMTLLLIADLAWWRPLAIIAGLAMLTCIGQVQRFSPFNMPHIHLSDERKETSFTLMTYNVYNFDEFRQNDGDENRQLAYILRKNPDIVCLQEAMYISPTKQNKITQKQLDSLHIIYPYVFTQGMNFALLSKFPAQPINLDFPKKEFASGDIAAWRLNIHGRVVNLFSVHLRSLGLTDDDKGAYQDIVKLDSITKRDIHDAKSAIVPKLAAAGVEREAQIRYLQKYLQRYGGKNALICGDFNDAVNCYGLYLLEHESHMRQAYADVGLGPMITYNANDLYFRIDHILYRGDMHPYTMSRGNIKASDHYPVIARFYFE